MPSSFNTNLDIENSNITNENFHNEIMKPKGATKGVEKGRRGRKAADKVLTDKNTPRCGRPKKRRFSRSSGVEEKSINKIDETTASILNDCPAETSKKVFTSSTPSTSKGADQNNGNEKKKGEYMIESEGVQMEKFSILYRNNLHNHEDIDDDSGDEHPNSLILLNDRWKQDYDNGVQMLVNPNEYPSFESKKAGFKLEPKSEFKLNRKLITIDKEKESEIHSFMEILPQQLYEGDLLDEIYVDLLNKKRSKCGKPWIKLGKFLEIMNLLEIECYKKIHEILLRPLHSPSINNDDANDDDAACDICRIKECDIDDEMVYCDGCNICVHMSCYGLTELPEGEWLCQACLLSNGKCRSCVLCPTLGGAMKPTKFKDFWAHVVCALWLPECRFGDVEKREPIMAIEEISDDRWNSKCSVCDTRQGACIRCYADGCPESFHVTCALRSGYTMIIEQLESSLNDDRVEMISYCQFHSNVSTTSSPTSKLENLEKVFYLHVDCESLVKRMNGVTTLMISDVFEYWKQKRSENGGKPLIFDPQDSITIDLEPVKLTLAKMKTEAEEKKIAARKIIEDEERAKRRQFRAAVDKDRNILTMLVKREKLKRQLLQTEGAAILEICEFSMKNVISQRASEGLFDILEKLFDGKNDIDDKIEPSENDIKTTPKVEEVVYRRLPNKRPLVLLDQSPTKRGKPLTRKVVTGAKCPRVRIVSK